MQQIAIQPKILVMIQWKIGECDKLLHILMVNTNSVFFDPQVAIKFK